MIVDLVPRVREALKVSSGFDADTITNGIRRSCKFLLREYDFPKTRLRIDLGPLALNGDNIALPEGFQKPYEAKLTSVVNGERLYRDLDRGLHDELPKKDGYGPRTYSIVGTTLYLDTPMPEAGYSIRLWYKSLLLDATSEAWLTDDFEDIVFVFSTMELATELSKPEVEQAYQNQWARRQLQLGHFLPEAEYSDTNYRMQPAMPEFVERYPTGG